MQQTRTSSTVGRILPRVGALPRSLFLDWAYSAVDKRDLRLDLLRGFAVFAMVVDHWGGNSWLYGITGGDTFLVSAAEGFIFISGLVVGMVYGAIALKEGIQAAQSKALQRALTLYKLTVVLTLLFAIFSLFFNLPWAKDLRIGDVGTFIFNVVTLRQVVYLTDIPLMYTILMLVAPLAIWLLASGRTRWLVGGSAALWLASQLSSAPAGLPWTIYGGGAFNLAAWQLLFFIAMAIGYHRDVIARAFSRVPLWPYTALVGLISAWFVQLYRTDGAFLLQFNPGMDTHAFLLQFFLKSAMAPGRLIASFFIFQFAYLLLTVLWKPIQVALGWFLLPLGQTALYGYTMHIALIGLFTMALPHFPVDVTTMRTVNTSLQLLAVLVLWAMVQRRFLFKVVPR
jgi:hypothetical protein